MTHEHLDWARLPHAHTQAVLLVVTCLAMGGCDGCKDPPTDLVACSAEPLPVMSNLDPCVYGEAVVGPVRVDRDHGSPGRETFQFSTASAGSYCLLVTNGSSAEDRATAGWIRLDDRDVAGPDRFLRHEPSFRVRGDLDPGDHALEVRVASMPGSFIRLQLLFAPTLPEDQVRASEMVSELEQEVCRETARRAGTLDPAQLEQVRTLAEWGGVAPSQLRVRYNAYRVPRFLAPLPEVDLGLAAGSRPEEVALAWMEHYRPMFRLSDPRVSFEVVDSRGALWGNSIVLLQQRVEGVVVQGARMQVWVDSSGVVREFAGDVVPSLPATVEPGIPSSTAVATAREEFGHGPDAEVAFGPRLELLDLAAFRQDPRSVLAWHVALAGDWSRAAYWIDAGDGSVAHAQDATMGAAEHCPADPAVRGDTICAEMYYFDPAWHTAGYRGALLLNLTDTCISAIDDCCLKESPYRTWCNDAFLWDVINHEEFWERFCAERDPVTNACLRGEPGWSDDGWTAPSWRSPSSFQPNEPYRILYDSALTGPALDDPCFNTGTPDQRVEWAARPLLQYYDQVTFDADGTLRRGDDVAGRTAVLGPGWATKDILFHEFGHGFHQWAARWTPDYDVPQRHFLSIAEHIADFWAFAPDDFAIENEVDVIRDVSLEGWPTAHNACLNIRHLSQFDSTQSGALDFAGARSCSMLNQAYVNSCVLSKGTHLLMRSDSGPVEFHGVTSEPLPWDLGRWAYYHLFAEHLDPTFDVHDYGYALRRDVVIDVTTKCSTIPRPLPCVGGTEDGQRVIDAADAVGFWSPANNLSQRVAEGSPPILPRSGIAVVNADGRLWAYFIGSTGTAPDAPLDLFAVEIPDPTSEDPVDRPIVHALGAGEDLLPEFDVAATYAGWEVWLAHHVADAGTRPGGTVRIHHGLPESPLTSIETLPQPRETNGEITIAWHMGRLYMVWGDRGTGVLPVSFLNCRTWPGDSACYPMVCREATPGGTMVCPPGSQGRFPQLVPPPASGAPLWLVDGAESCLGSGCDPQFTLEARMLADSWEWSAPQGLRVMTPQARNSTESNLQPFAVGPLGAAWHAGHLQVVSQRSPFARPSEISHVTEASFEHFPAGTFTEDVKAVELEAEAAGRPALVRWLDPLGRWLVVMFWRTADPATPRLMAAYKRSD